MARIRSIKPEFWDNQYLKQLSSLARLTFIGLWSQADDEGRGHGDPDWLWGRLHAGCGLNVRKAWREALRELGWTEAEANRSGSGAETGAKRGRSGGEAGANVGGIEPNAERIAADVQGVPLVVWYWAEGHVYYWIPTFTIHQRIKKPYKSKLPPPHGWGTSSEPVRNLPALEQGAGSREQGAGGARGPGGEPATPKDDPKAGGYERKPVMRSGSAEAMLWAIWDKGSGAPINGEGGQRLIRIALDRGMKFPEAEQAFWDQQRCRSKKIWEVMDPITPVPERVQSGEESLKAIMDKWVQNPQTGKGAPAR